MMIIAILLGLSFILLWYLFLKDWEDLVKRYIKAIDKHINNVTRLNRLIKDVKEKRKYLEREIARQKEEINRIKNRKS